MDLILLYLLAVPLIGALLGAFLPARVAGRGWGVMVSLATTLVAIMAALQFNWGSGVQQFTFAGPRLALPQYSFELTFKLGVDSISMLMVLLTVLVHPIAMVASMESVSFRAREHYVWMNLLLAGTIGVFVARDLLLFYAFFEFTLVPVFFLLGIWGGPERRTAAAKQFIYTFSGSVFMLTAMIYLGYRAGTFDMEQVISFAQHQMSPDERLWVFIGLLCGLGVKTPLWPLHTWLPLAHTEAPSGGQVDLASLVLKLGAYGLLTIAIPIGLVDVYGSLFYREQALVVLGVLCVVGIIYCALVAWAQQDAKKLVAYSSVSHLGFCVLGMLALNDIGLQGSVLYMIVHGINSGAMFLIIGMIYSRYRTRDITELGGLGKVMPRLSFFLVLFVMASVGLPLTSGFVAEFLTILGAFTSTELPHAKVFGIVSAVGIVLGAVYLLKLTAALLYGPLKFPQISDQSEPQHADRTPPRAHGDLSGREVFVLTPLAILTIALGVYPTPLLNTIAAPLRAMRQPVAETADVRTTKPEARSEPEISRVDFFDPAGVSSTGRAR